MDSKSSELKFCLFFLISNFLFILFYFILYFIDKKKKNFNRVLLLDEMDSLEQSIVDEVLNMTTFEKLILIGKIFFIVQYQNCI